MKTVETVAIGDVRPGMRLAEALLDESGRVLVPGGCELTDSMVHGLMRRDIAELTIEREIEEDPATRAAREARVIAQLDRLFRKAGDGLETRQLYRAILDFRMADQA
ncbi:hypothetical protein [Dechloromonas denitrificans]|uniref:hypothetical protein n=1 Tax=Dechloromonas denitrificans TaxID=281362 RepID=UPI001CF8B572|nr:hypothetical protein [Dechloromonas denitrificans]UCV01814.1 hypothetical protein KI611_11880 [Dechloromonas denitrificans]UCV06164.1 hypothetical protein KI615_12035 [Dechloromonas denitrificans]